MNDKNGKDERPYKVLVPIARSGFRQVWEGDARNAEHAARQAMKKNKSLRVDHVITVPLKMWTEVPVRRNVTETISVG